MFRVLLTLVMFTKAQILLFVYTFSHLEKESLT